MNVDTEQFAALCEQVDGHDAALRRARATLDELFTLMRDVVREAGLDTHVSAHGLKVLPGGAPAEGPARPRGRLVAVRDER